MFRFLYILLNYSNKWKQKQNVIDILALNCKIMLLTVRPYVDFWSFFNHLRKLKIIQVRRNSITYFITFYFFFLDWPKLHLFGDTTYGRIILHLRTTMKKRKIRLLSGFQWDCEKRNKKTITCGWNFFIFLKKISFVRPQKFINNKTNINYILKINLFSPFEFRIRK